jgi:hypothetical protein
MRSGRVPISRRILPTLAATGPTATLVDPIAIAIAIAGELGEVLGDAGGREAARLWRLKQLEYSFRLRRWAVTRTSAG